MCRRDAGTGSFFSISPPWVYGIRLSNRCVNPGLACSALKRRRKLWLFVWLFESTGPEWVTNRFLPTWRESYIFKSFSFGVQMAESCRVRIVILTVSQSGAAIGTHGIGRRGKAERFCLELEIDERLHFRRDELVSDENGQYDNCGHQRQRHARKPNAITAFPVVRQPMYDHA